MKNTFFKSIFFLVLNICFVAQTQAMDEAERRRRAIQERVILEAEVNPHLIREVVVQGDTKFNARFDGPGIIVSSRPSRPNSRNQSPKSRNSSPTRTSSRNQSPDRSPQARGKSSPTKNSPASRRPVEPLSPLVLNDDQPGIAPRVSFSDDTLSGSPATSRARASSDQRDRARSNRSKSKHSSRPGSTKSSPARSPNQSRANSRPGSPPTRLPDLFPNKSNNPDTERDQKQSQGKAGDQKKPLVDNSYNLPNLPSITKPSKRVIKRPTPLARQISITVTSAPGHDEDVFEKLRNMKISPDATPNEDYDATPNEDYVDDFEVEAVPTVHTDDQKTLDERCRQEALTELADIHRKGVPRTDTLEEIAQAIVKSIPTTTKTSSSGNAVDQKDAKPFRKTKLSPLAEELCEACSAGDLKKVQEILERNEAKSLERTDIGTAIRMTKKYPIIQVKLLLFLQEKLKLESNTVDDRITRALYTLLQGN